MALHADYLTVTVPEDHSSEPLAQIHALLADVGAACVKAGVFKLANGGAFNLYLKNRVRIFAASGAALSQLRDLRLFDAYLSIFCEAPHSVSRLDIALDLPIDGPEALRRLRRRRDGPEPFRLNSRKVVPMSSVRIIESVRASDSAVTGTVYIGRQTAERRARVYDKQYERLEKAGLSIPPTTRFEVTLTGKTGISLRDAWEPASCFWHFMGDVMRGFARRPHTLPEWVPMLTGFSLPSVPTPLPAVAVRRLVETDPFLARAVFLADSVGPEGRRLLLRLIEQQVLSLINQSDQTRSPSGDSLERAS